MTEKKQQQQQHLLKHVADLLLETAAAVVDDSYWYYGIDVDDVVVDAAGLGGVKIKKVLMIAVRKTMMAKDQRCGNRDQCYADSH